MNIHPLWYLCIFIRLISVVLLNKFKKYKNTILTILLIIGLGFIYQGKYSSNNNLQIAKVFWHDARYIHGILYLLAAYYFYKKDIKLTTIILLSDIAFSFIYRLIKNK